MRLTWYDNRSRRKLKKYYIANNAIHPFVIIALVAALAVVIWAIAFRMTI